MPGSTGSEAAEPTVNSYQQNPVPGYILLLHILYTLVIFEHQKNEI